MTKIGFFNHKGGVGKTTICYHLACYMHEYKKVRVALVDADPQCNLTLHCIQDARAERIWEANGGKITKVDARADEVPLVTAGPNLSSFDDVMALAWNQMEEGGALGFRVFEEFQRSIRSINAEVTFVDLGPNLGPLNRAALLACDWLVIPVAPDLFSTRGIKRVAHKVSEWSLAWVNRYDRAGSVLNRTPPKILGYVHNRVNYHHGNPVAVASRFLQAASEVFAVHVNRDWSKEMCQIGDMHSLLQKAQQHRCPAWKIPSKHLTDTDKSKINRLKGDMDKLADTIMDRIRTSQAISARG